MIKLSMVINQVRYRLFNMITANFISKDVLYTEDEIKIVKAELWALKNLQKMY